MKRRKFLKRAALGLGALTMQSGVWAGPGTKGTGDRLYGTPGSVSDQVRLEQNLLRLELSEGEVPVEVWDEMVACATMARDVFRDARAAEEFRRSPERYLQSKGLSGVQLSPEWLEIRVALALGDPGLREAATRQDPGRFLEELNRLDLLQAPNPSLLANKIGAQLEQIGQASVSDGPTPEACTLTAICLAVVWIWVTVIQDVVAAVTAAAFVTIYVSVLVLTTTIGPRKRTMVEMLRSHPSLGLARAMGGDHFGEKVIHRLVAENVEAVAEAVEILPVYRRHLPMTGEELRDLIRGRMLRHLVRGEPTPGECKP